MQTRMNLFESLLAAHVVEGEVRPGETVGWRVDQTLLQDTTGGSVMLALEALGIDSVRTDVSVQYVDHQIVRSEHPTPQDDLYRQNRQWLESACRRFGLWFSTPGNGISHQLHAERFAVPGASLLGADSHTCAAGALGMLAVGAGGLDVALALAGQPCRIRVPRSRRIRLVGALPPWVSARDVGLELLRRFGVDGGVGWAYGYTGPALAELDVMERHVIAGFGAETGATTSVFPCDAVVRDFLGRHGRTDDWADLPDPDDAAFDNEHEIDLASVEPLIALPSSPGNVVPVREVAGAPIAQAYFASAGNPGYAGYAVPAEMLRDRRVAPEVAVDVNPPSARIAAALERAGLLDALAHAGATIHPAGCDEFHRATQAPPPGELSLRTVNRNFPGRSGTKGDRVALVSAETAAASALLGVVTDPRTLDRDAPRPVEPTDVRQDAAGFVAPLPVDQARQVVVVKGPNVVSLPEGRPLPDDLRAPVILTVGDGVSTDEILPAGPQEQAYRTNVPVLARAAFAGVDSAYVERARAAAGGHVIVAGANYGQGSSREHAALVPRYLGLVAVLAEGFARIHRDNLVNHGVLPLTFMDPADRRAIATGDELAIPRVRRQLTAGAVVVVDNRTRGRSYRLAHDLTDWQIGVIVDGGVIRHVRVALGGPRQRG